MKFFCTKQSFTPTNTRRVRWLDQNADFPLARNYWALFGQPLTRQTWDQVHDELGYRYAAIVENGHILSCAAVWCFSRYVWDVSAVSTAPASRRQGYAKAVVSFVTAHILESGRTPMTSTDDDNLAMIATARSVGFFAY